MKIAIIGAGMAGLACAGVLAAAGTPATLFDKGRGAGGRMSSRRVATVAGEAGFDHGAQYFSARDPGFRAVVAGWGQDGLVAPWPAAGPDCWVGTPAMSAPVKRMAAGAAVHWGVRVDAIAGEPGAWRLQGDGLEEENFAAVLLAVPAENAAPLLRAVAPEMAAVAAATPAEPCWTLMAAFAEAVPVETDILREQGGIGWAARNSAKPGRTGPEAWVIQAGIAWSRAHLEKAPDDIVPSLLAEFSARIGAALPPVLSAAAHRWRYARSGKAGMDMLWESARKLGACGDWLIGPRVECAWLSGERLARAVLSA